MTSIDDGAQAPAPAVLASTNPKDLLGLRKAPLRLLSGPAMIRLACVMGLGAIKYGPWNWRKNKVLHTVYLEAALRHIFQALDGEDVDAESGQPHEAHVMACMMIIMDAKAVSCLIDDRNKGGATEGVLASVKGKDEPTVLPSSLSNWPPPGLSNMLGAAERDAPPIDVHPGWMGGPA
jgi:hypothetical protein